MTFGFKYAPREGRIAAVVVTILWMVASIVIALTLSYDDVRAATALAHRAPIILVIWAFVPAATLVWGIRCLLYRRLRRGVAWSAVAIVAVLVFFFGEAAGDSLRFWLNRSTYDRIVYEAQHGHCVVFDCSRPLTIQFEWGGFGNRWHGLVWDESDEIAKPSAKRSDTWKQRRIGEVLAKSAVYRKMGYHYYLVAGRYH